MDSTYKYKNQTRMWKVVCLFLLLLVLALTIALIVVIVKNNQETEQQKMIKPCDLTHEDIDLTETDVPGIFHDMTDKELRSVLAYLMSVPDLELVSGKNVVPKSSYIHHVELIPPKKTEALEYLDKNGTKPERWAKAVIFRGDLKIPQVEEYRVGPLLWPKKHALIGKPINYAYRPFVSAELASFGEFFKVLDKQMSVLLDESYGARFFDCGEKCLSFSFAGVSSHAYDAPTRHVWFAVYQNIPYMSLYPVDMLILVNVDSLDAAEFRVLEIRYGQQIFKDVSDLMDSYNNNKPGFKKYNVPYPTGENDTMFSSMKIRDEELPKSSLRPPSTYEPDGKRYTIKDNHITYMGWEFDLRMVTTRGPALYDVRFLGDRIAYELAFQEIAVFYSANNPAYGMLDLLSSVLNIGSLSRALVPGYDCPKHATFIPVVHVVDGAKEPVRYNNALCVFEMDTGVPLHRHHAYTHGDGAFYGGMPDYVLTIRTIIVVVNYDYMIDFVFHQSGAMEVKARSTGYLITGYPSAAEKPYGWTLRKNVFGPIHHHMFNFKVDLDIHGTSNRFEKLNIVPTSVKNTWSAKPNDDYHQIKFDRTLVKTEDDARYNYDFTKPTYIIFHNNEFQNTNRVPKSYRLHPTGISKSLLPPDQNAEISVSWARQQVAVTTQKDDEEWSSSIYSFWDSHEPTVKFDGFINGEDIVDQDLVAWVTLSTYHLPHTEDLPSTPTPAAALSFSLTPYNYYPTCPSFRSRDGLYMEVDKKGSVNIQEEGNSQEKERSRDNKGRKDKDCVRKDKDFLKSVQEEPSRMFLV